MSTVKGMFSQEQLKQLELARAVLRSSPLEEAAFDPRGSTTGGAAAARGLTLPGQGGLTKPLAGTASQATDSQ